MRQKMKRFRAWISKLRITDDTLRTALLVGGFFIFVWGLWDLAPWAAKIIGGLCLVWFAWPTSERGR